MPDRKTFACAHCDHNIEVEDVRNVDEVACPGCSHRYRVNYVEQESAWELIRISTVEGEPGEPAERDDEHPFRVLGENAGLRDDDTDRFK